MERRLGRLAEGWTTGPDSRRMPFRIGHFQEGVLSGVDTYATIGLSKYGFKASNSEKEIHQEILIGVHSAYASESLVGAVYELGMRVVNHGRPILRGEIIESSGSLVPQSRLDVFYAAIPVYYDDDFSGVDLESGNRAVMVWAVPIASAEADYIAQAGWLDFEKRLIAQDPDLLDPLRGEIRL
ncbi:suppressor of fused domain protein [Actinoallomurus acanthiterrae]